jgi:hypothetical protein
MSRRRKVPLAWNEFCDDNGAVIGRFAVEGNMLHVANNRPGGGTKLVKIEPGEGFLSLVQIVLDDPPADGR